MTPQAIEHEVEMLHQMLYSFEGLESLVVAHEIIDLNKYRVISKPHKLRKIIRYSELKAFVFLNCKN